LRATLQQPTKVNRGKHPQPNYLPNYKSIHYNLGGGRLFKEKKYLQSKYFQKKRKKISKIRPLKGVWGGRPGG